MPPAVLTAPLTRTRRAHAGGAAPPMPPPDPFPDWCRRLASGDAAAFEELFRHTYDALLAYAASLTHDRAAAADLVQDAYLRVWERRTTLDPDRSLKALLYRTARNLALNLARDGRTRADLLDRHYDPNPHREPPPDEVAAGRQLGARLQAWIAELPDRQREALHLSRFEGLSHDEIADVMDVSPRTVNNHLVRALRHLRTRTAAYAPDLLHA